MNQVPGEALLDQWPNNTKVYLTPLLVLKIIRFQEKGIHICILWQETKSYHKKKKYI
jgi:hypothetical protein